MTTTERVVMSRPAARRTRAAGRRARGGGAADGRGETGGETVDVMQWCDGNARGLVGKIALLGALLARPPGAWQFEGRNAPPERGRVERR
jgi:hypothetical protein